MLHVGATRQLFLDDLAIDRMDGCHRRFHRPVRHPENPVVPADRPWETGHPRQGTCLFGGTVFYDDDDRIFKMWYRTSELHAAPADDRQVAAATAGHRPGFPAAGIVPVGGYRACYATSTDGIHWDKPDLGLATYGDIAETNILPAGRGDHQFIRRPSLIKDHDEPDASRRYKMIYADEGEDEWLLKTAFSPDGVHWQMDIGEPSRFPPPLLPLGILFGWDPRLGRYVHFHRKSSTGAPADIDGRRVRAEQALMRSTSDDFQAWGSAQEIVRRDDAIDPPGWDVSHAGLLAATLYTDDLYVGFLDTCLAHDVADVRPELWDVFQHEHAAHRTELVISRDGDRWTRVAPHWEVLAPGLWGTWDREIVTLAKPMVWNDEVRIYYTGYNVPCGGHMIGHPQQPLIGTIVDGQPMGNAIGLATMRLDGFASIEAGEERGTLTTPPLTFTGDRLVVNARAPERRFDDASTTGGEPFGRLTVAILDADGTPIDGLQATDCDAFSGDELRHVVTWNRRSDLMRLEGLPIRVRFELRNAALYAFQFRGASEPASMVDLHAPGNRGRPARQQSVQSQSKSQPSRTE